MPKLRLARFVVVLVHSAACSEEARAPFVADLTYEQVAVAGGQDETNDLFIAGSPVPWLVDSTVVTYADQAMGGRLTVADMVGRAGWSISHPRGVDGPGELNGHVPLVSSSGDTVKTLRGDGRLAARLIEDGTLLYDRQVPWQTFYPFIDGTGRVWVQVFGGVREGMNLMLFTRELELIGQAIIPGFRDAYGDYVLSVRRDSLDVQTMILSRLMH